MLVYIPAPWIRHGISMDIFHEYSIARFDAPGTSACRVTPRPLCLDPFFTKAESAEPAEEQLHYGRTDHGNHLKKYMRAHAHIHTPCSVYIHIDTVYIHI